MRRCYVDRERVYTCGACRDSGLVEVWHPATVRFFREAFSLQAPESWQFWERDERWKEYSPHYRSVVMACKCARGDVERKTKLMKYDPDKYCLFDAFSGEGLMNWLQEEHCYDTVTGEYANGLSGEF